MYGCLSSSWTDTFDGFYKLTQVVRRKSRRHRKTGIPLGDCSEIPVANAGVGGLKEAADRRGRTEALGSKRAPPPPFQAQDCQGPRASFHNGNPPTPKPPLDPPGPSKDWAKFSSGPSANQKISLVPSAPIC